MLVGHFAAGLAAKKFAPEVSLGCLFAAALLLDFIWSLLVLVGIEQAGFDHSLASFNGLDMIYIPYSHSLGMAIIWGGLFGGVLGYLYRSRTLALVIGLLVVSHWFLDYLTHIPDMTLWFDGERFGLGLWRSSWLTLLVNIVLLVLALAVYFKSTGSVRGRSVIFWSLIAFLLVLSALHSFAPRQPEATVGAMVGGPALGLLIPVIWGYFADRRSQLSG